MDRRSWLWRRNNLEKNQSGETESSGSVSSHSERFSDDQSLSNPNNQSPEVTSKAADCDELNDSVKSLSEQLSEALAEIRSKEDSVKQHAKVAEEAVSGWESCENEIFVLKKQVEVLTQENSVLEERVSHLDGALKESLRQLRQAREEQEDKINEALVSKSSEWESKKSQLESQIVQLHSELHNAKVNTIERDLSTRAAEAASKHHLDSLKKVAKLEAECRRLKAMAKKTSSIYSESVADSQSDYGDKMSNCEIDLRKYKTTSERSFAVPSTEIDIMDDFLEMERLAECTDPHSGRNDETWENQRQNGEFEAMMNRTGDLEEKLLVMAKEKRNLESDLNDCRIRLMMSEEQVKQTRAKLVELSTELNRVNDAKRTTEREVEFTKVNASKLLDEAEFTVEQVQNQLAEVNDAKRAAEREVEFTKVNASKLLDEAEFTVEQLQNQLAEVNDAKRAAEREVEFTKVNASKLLDEAEFTVEQLQNQLTEVNEAKINAEAALNNANVKKAEAESKLEEMERQLRILRSKIVSLEEEVQSERKFSCEALAKCEKLDSQVQNSVKIDEFRINQDQELAMASNKFAECQKTIASLGRQLKSLANFEDVLTDSERQETVMYKRFTHP